MLILAKMAGLCWALIGLGLCPRAAAQDAPAIPEVIHFSGRVLCATGPLKGVRIEAFDSEGGTREILSLQDDLEAARREAAARALGVAVQTDREGRWTLSVPTQGVRLAGLGFRVLSKTHASVLLYPLGELSGNEWTAEDIHLSPGIRIRGFVQFVNGHESEEVRGRLLRSGGHYRRPALTGRVGHQRSFSSQVSAIAIDQNGEFQTDWAVDIGIAERSSSWAFDSDENWASLFGFLDVYAQCPRAHQLLRLVRTKPVAIHGHVRDHEGNPLGGANVTLIRRFSDQIPRSVGFATSRPDGSFQLSVQVDGLSTYRVYADCSGYFFRHDAGSEERTLSRKDERFEIVMLPEHDCHLIPRRKSDGTSLSGFTVRMRSESSSGDWVSARDGQPVSLRRSQGQTTAIEILPADHDLAETTPIVLPGKDVIRELTIDVPRRVRRELVLQDPQGAPIENATVRVVLPWPQAAATIEREAWQPGSAWPKNGLLRKTLHTDEFGRTVIDAAEGVAIELQIEAVGIRRQLTSGVLMKQDAAPFLATVDRLPAAAVTGRVGPEAWRDAYRQEAIRQRLPVSIQGLLLRREGTDPWPERWPEEGLIRLLEDGSFACEGVPPGRWRLMFQCSDGSVQGVPQEAIPVSAPFDLSTGERLNFDLDLRDQIPAEVKAQVIINDTPIDLWIAKWYRGAKDGEGSMAIEVAPKLELSSQFERSLLPPGDYHLRISNRSFSHGYSMGVVEPRTTLPDHVTVAAGTAKTIVFDVQVHTGITLRLTRPQTPYPVPGVMVLLRTGPTDQGTWLGQTSTPGVIELPHLVAGRHEILILPRATAQTLKPRWWVFDIFEDMNDRRGRAALSRAEAQLIKIGEIEVTRSDQLFELAVPAGSGWW